MPAVGSAPSPALLHQLRTLAARTHPREAVALVLCSPRRCIAVPLRNLADDPQRHFRVEPLEFARIEHALRRRGFQVLALFHSHPMGPARPSPADRAAAWSGLETWIGAPTSAGFELGRFDAKGRPLSPATFVPMRDPL